MAIISPNVLEFSSPFSQPSTKYIQIANDSDETIAFKVKTTAPKVYCVRPNAATLEPGASLEVSVILLGLKEEPAPDFKCNDKFLIVSLPSPYDLGDKKVSDIWPKLEAEFKAQSVSKKIKVNYIINQPEEEKPESSAQSTAPLLEKVSSATTEEEIDQDRSRIDELNEKLDSNVAKSSSAKSTKSSNSSEKAVVKSSSTPITTVLLIALIAFIVGWLFF